MTDKHFQSVCMKAFERFKWLVLNSAGGRDAVVASAWTNADTLKITVDGRGIRKNQVDGAVNLLAVFIAAETKGEMKIS